MENLKFSLLVLMMFCVISLHSQVFKPFQEGSFWGIKMKDSIYLAANFDEIYQDKTNKNLLHTKKNGLYGIFEFEYKPKEIKPISQVELKYAGLARFEMYYYEKYYQYIDSKGNKLFISWSSKFNLKCNPETLFAQKKGKFFYLYGLDSIGSKNKALKSLDSKFLYLEQTRFKLTFIAQSLNKKFGLINCLGDTLLPFEYSSLDFFDYDGDGNHHILLGVDKKKVLFNFTLKKIQPYYFDEIEKLSPSSYSNLFITKSNGKYGLFCIDDGFDVFPNEFEKIFIVNKDKSDYYKYIIGFKNSKYYALTLKGLFLNKSNLPFQLKEYDFIQNNFGLIKNGDNYDFYQLKDHTFVKSMNQNVVDLNEK